MQMLRKFSVVIILVSMCSCATIFSGRRENVFVETYPSNALISRNGECLGITPALISIDRKSKEPLELVKEGYVSQTIRVRRSMNPFFILNFGNPVAYKIDIMSGASFRFDQRIYIRSLQLQSEENVTNEVSMLVDSAGIDGEVFWEAERKLTANDFKRKMSDEDQYFSGGTSARIACSYFRSDTGLTAQITSIFSGHDSFLRQDRNLPKILKHEQIHFDICEIYAREIRKQLSLTTFDSCSFKEGLNALCFKAIQEMESRQACFDEEISNTPVRKNAIALWNRQIRLELLQLIDYSKPVVPVKFSNICGDQSQLRSADANRFTQE
jgi:hypothetical protein